MEACIIQGMEPFNEVYYRDCFFNSLFSVMNYFQVDISYVLGNDIFYYECLQDSMNLQIKCHEIKEVNEILLDHGIRVESKIYSEDIVGEIKNCINQNQPVILAVDSFFCPNILDCYEKSHNTHTILIEGYDDKENLFSIIDLEILNNLTYKKFVITYEQLLAAHSCDLIIENQKNGENTIFQYCKTDKRCQTSPIRFIFLRNFKSKERELLAGMDAFELFIQHFEGLDHSEQIQSSKKILDSFVEIFNYKKIEYYRFNRIFGKDHAFTIELQKLQDIWKQIMSNYGLFHYSAKKPESYTAKVSALLREAYGIERKLILEVLECREEDSNGY